METFGYNTLEDRKNPEEVQNNGPFICTRANAWLGHGYYFWEQDLERAHDWGRIAYSKSYMICQADLNLPKILDLLGNIAHRKYFKELISYLQSNFDAFKGESKNIAIGHAIHFLRKINSRPKYKGVFDYDSVRAEDFPQKGSNKLPFAYGRPETFDLNSRVQICVFNKDLGNISHYKLVYPKEYLQAKAS